MTTTLEGRVCLVTGATRGIGKGIALQLAEKGATVYVTGRTLEPRKGKVGGSLRETASEIEARGGRCIPVQCDHSSDADTKRLFEQIAREQDGQLDVLVNNAFSAGTALFNNMGVDFWDLPISMWDDVNGVGLRNQYVCAHHAANLMVARKRGLIVNISAMAGLRYLGNVPFGVGKEASDRMAADCGFELRKQNVAFISVWPGMVGTENSVSMTRGEVTKLQEGKQPRTVEGAPAPDRMLELLEVCETAEFAGQCIASLACDPNVMKKSGKICLTADLGREYGLRDKKGHTPLDICSIKSMLGFAGKTWLAALIPSFVRIPKFLLALAGNKFN